MGRRRRLATTILKAFIVFLEVGGGVILFKVVLVSIELFHKSLSRLELIRRNLQLVISDHESTAASSVSRRSNSGARLSKTGLIETCL